MTTIYGIKTRTNNSKPQEIGLLWEEFFKTNPQGEIYAVYTNYQSDFHGDYDLIIGSTFGKAEFEFTIPNGDYLEIPVEGNSPTDIITAWQKIWLNKKLPRTYKVDFEKYCLDGSVKIYLSI